MLAPVRALKPAEAVQVLAATMVKGACLIALTMHIFRGLNPFMAMFPSRWRHVGAMCKSKYRGLEGAGA